MGEDSKFWFLLRHNCWMAKKIPSVSYWFLPLRLYFPGLVDIFYTINDRCTSSETESEAITPLWYHILWNLKRIFIVFLFQHFFFLLWICYLIFAKGAVLRTDPAFSGFWPKYSPKCLFEISQNQKSPWNFTWNFMKICYKFHVKFSEVSAKISPEISVR